VEREVEKKNEEAECDMLCNTSSISANLQHNIAALRVLTRTVSVKGTDMVLTEEPW
jgi:hypothetical protein